ncbi:MAG: MoxR family ATPase [Planctomycetota bacterium]|nr:MoxR family ATPase [Planctomycetota bacterium]
MTSTATTPVLDAARYKELSQKVAQVRLEVGKVIVGQNDVMDQVLMALFAGSHCLMEGVPGLAKTLLVSTLSRVLHLSFKRVQFTPDLMPGDITGADIMEEQPDGKRRFVFVEGPLFANLILADEVNRTPPRTQAALLEAMQEHRVTVGRATYKLPQPFLVLATQNPIEQEGTYPLPEAQQDRFMFFIDVEYPEKAEEVEVVRRTTANRAVELQAVLSGPEILEIQKIVREIPVADHLVEFAVNVSRASRLRRGAEGDAAVPAFVKKYGQWGAGPRASQFLVLGAKARAFLLGKSAVAQEDIEAVAVPVLRHRIVVNFAAEAEGVTSRQLIRDIIAHVKKG